MDYFNQLLDSYTKIKKRTFKLEYLSEEEVPDRNSAIESIKNAAATAFQGTETTHTPPGAEQGAPPLYLKQFLGTESKPTKPGGAIEIGGAAGPYGSQDKKFSASEWATAIGNPDKPNTYLYSFVSAWMGGSKKEALDTAKTTEDDGPTDQVVADIEEKEAWNQDVMSSVGGSIRIRLRNELMDPESDRYDPSLNELGAMKRAQQLWDEDQGPGGLKDLMGPSIKRQYYRQFAMLRNKCKEIQDGPDKPAGMKNSWGLGTDPTTGEAQTGGICNNPMGYIAGGSDWSLESRLENGAGNCFSQEEDEAGKMVKEVKAEGEDQFNQKCKIMEGDKLMAVEGNTFLLKFLDKPDTKEEGEDRCKKLSTRIGLHGKGRKQKVVFFDSELDPDSGRPTRGVVVRPNRIQALAIKAAQSSCTEEAARMENVLNITISTQDKNAIKGTIYETVPQLSIYVRDLKRSVATRGEAQELLDSLSSDDPRNIQAQQGFDEAHAEVLRYNTEMATYLDEVLLGEKRAILEAVRQEAQGEGATTTEKEVSQILAEEQLEIVESKRNLAKWLLSEVSIMEDWCGEDMFGAEFTYHSGLAPKTGARADNNLCYLEESDAIAACEANGFKYDPKKDSMTRAQMIAAAPPLERDMLDRRMLALGIVNDDDRIYLMPFGQKKIEKGGSSTKSGELASQTILDDYFDGEDPKGNVAPGYFGAVDLAMGYTTGKTYTDTLDAQGNPIPVVDADGPVLDEKGEPTYEQTGTHNDKELQELVEYQRGVEKSTETAQQMSEPVVYKNSKGELEIATPEAAAEMITNKLLAQADIQDIKGLGKGSEFYGIFFNEDGEARNFSDKLVQQRATEFLERWKRVQTLQTDLNGSDSKKAEQAKATLLRTLVIAGYNNRPMAQVKGTGEGTIEWSHNEPMDDLLAAGGMGPNAGRGGALEITFEGMTAVYSIDGERVMTMNQEGQWGEVDGKKEGRKTRTNARNVASDIKRRDAKLKKKREKLKKKSKASPVNADTLYDFLSGQMSLLESLLSRTKKNPLQ